MAGEKPPQHGRVERIGVEKGPTERVQKLHEQILKRPVVRQQRGREAAEAGRPDQFRMGSLLPKFLRAVQKRLDSSWLYQTFKLPGTSYIVRDMRNQQPQSADQARTPDRAAEFQMREGQPSETQGKSRANYLGDRHNLTPQETKKEVEQIKRLLSEFEKLLVERFEKGKIVEQKSEDGKSHFRLKTLEEWKSFFSKFFKRSVWKNTELRFIKEFIFRGLVSLKKGDGKFAMLIGDMMMTDGQVDKFARLRVLSDLAKMLSNMEPGSTLEAELLKRGLTAENIRYLALAHKHAEWVIKMQADATKGMFGLLKTEEQVAKDLGIKRRGRQGKAYGGPLKWGEGGAKEEKHAFVPWGFWERQDRKGRPRTFVKIAFTVITLLIILAIWLSIRFILK